MAMGNPQMTRALDYDPADAEQIEQLLEELRTTEDPVKKQAVYDKLDNFVFGLSNAQD
jgi:hypothetical protein